MLYCVLVWDSVACLGYAVELSLTALNGSCLP